MKSLFIVICIYDYYYRKFETNSDVWPNGKALDVCGPLPGIIIMTNIGRSTNQEIHGSIPCSFK